MNIKNMSLLGSIVLCASNVAFAEQPPLTVYGTLNSGFEELNTGVDDGFRVNEATIGVKGPLIFGGVTAVYDIELDLTNAADPNGDGDVEVSNALIIFPKTKMGTFVLGRDAYAGLRRDVYGGVDIFDNTDTAHPINGATVQSSNLFEQPFDAPGVAVWETPKFGNFHGAAVALSLESGNGKAVDATAAVLAYNKGNVQAGTALVVLDESLFPTPKDSKRSSIGANYNGAKFQVGGVYESTKDDPSGDFNVMGLAGTFKVTPKFALKAAYFKKDHKDIDALDNDATILNASYTFGGVGKAKSAKLYLEHEAHELDAGDKTTAGVLLKF